MSFIPELVTKHVAEISRIVGITPEVTRVSDRRYRITIGNDRVHCTVDYKFTGNYWAWANSKLLVDGQPHEIMPNTTAFARLFSDPDSDGLKKLSLADIPELPIIELEPGDPTIRVIQHFEQRYRHIDPETVVTLVGTLDQPVLDIRMMHSVIRWSLEYRPRLVLFVMDGYDHIPRVKNENTVMADVFTILANRYGVPVPSAPATIPTLSGSTHAQSVSNAVRIRKQTVIRN